MKKDLFINILNDVQYKDWRINYQLRVEGITSEKVIEALIWVEFNAPDINTGKTELQKCRKWFIEGPFEEWQIVDTVFKAIKNAEEHEIKEQFSYKGKRIFNPHNDFLKET